MTLVYNFSFPPPAAGLTCTVKKIDGTQVASGSVGTTVGDDGAVVFPAELSEGTYQGFVTGFGPAIGLLDVEDSIEAGGSGVAADETAYFVSTGPTLATDGAGDFLTFVADSRHGALPDWASVNGDGNIALGSDAGTTALSVRSSFNFNFAGASDTPTAAGSISGGYSIGLDANSSLIGVSSGADADGAGNGSATQSSPSAIRGAVVVGSVVNMYATPSAEEDGTPINDGTATPRVALTITRIAQAAVLPD